MRVLKILCFVGAILISVSSARAFEKGRAGIGFFGSAHVPMFNFGKWYSISPKLGLSYNYVVNPKIIAEIEYHYSRMGGGDLAERRFRWSVDDNEHLSPQVSQKMSFNSIAANGIVHLRALGQGTTPYLTGGMGFFWYKNAVSGLIFPGQTGTTLDTGLSLSAYEDNWPALTAMLGAGVSIVTSERFLIDIRARYNIMLGELRPLEDWGLLKTFPLQAFDLMVGFKYFW